MSICGDVEGNLGVVRTILRQIYFRTRELLYKGMFTGLRGIHIKREGMFLMARQNLDTDMNSFMSTLRQLGSAGNGALRDALGWAESRYWKAHAALFESGKIKKGRGRGGSVSTGQHPRAQTRQWLEEARDKTSGALKK